RDRVDSLKMKNHVSAMILTEPAGFQPDAHRFPAGMRIAHKHFAQASKSLREIGEQLRGNFAFVASRAKNARHQNPSWSFQGQGRFGQGVPGKTTHRERINPRKSGEKSVSSFSCPPLPAAFERPLQCAPAVQSLFPNPRGAPATPIRSLATL